jgi:Pirin
MHPHRDMEILTWVLEGALEHRDSTDARGVIRLGELQHMTAGRGVMFNPSAKDPTHRLQIWILPERRGLDPSYEQLAFPEATLRGQFSLVAGPEAPVTIRQDASESPALAFGRPPRLGASRPGRGASERSRARSRRWCQDSRRTGDPCRVARAIGSLAVRLGLNLPLSRGLWYFAPG